MAANFWTSTQLKWLMPKERLLQSQQEDRAKGLSENHIQQLKVYFTQYIYDMSNSIKLRQRVAATAVVYFRRLYAGSSFSAHDPHLVAPGCLYLASKVEESVVAAKLLLASMKRLRPAWQYELKDLLDMEMVILEELDTHLVVFSPYLSLAKILESDAQLADLGQNAWAALNDVYRTDAPIIHAPHVLALGCLYLASVICSRDITAWLEGVDVDTNQIYAVSLELISVYECYRVPISQEECARLLAVVRPPPALPAAAAAAQLPLGAWQLAGSRQLLAVQRSESWGEAACSSTSAAAAQFLVGGLAVS